MKDLSNENVIHVKKDGIEYLQFRKLLEYSDIVKHAYAIGLDKNFRTARAKNATPLTPCLLYTSPSPRDETSSRMPSSA